MTDYSVAAAAAGQAGVSEWALWCQYPRHH